MKRSCTTPHKKRRKLSFSLSSSPKWAKMLSEFLRGRNDLYLSGGWAGGICCMTYSSLVAITIIATPGMTKPMGNTSDTPGVRSNVETACRSDHYSPDMGAHSLKPPRYHRPHLIAGLEAEIALRSEERRVGKECVSL